MASVQEEKTSATKQTWVRARYTVSKFRAFTHYSATASSRRIALVILLTPATTVLGSLLLPLIPLRDPNDGWKRNLNGFAMHLGAISWLSMFGASTQFRAGACISHDEYPTILLTLGSLVGAGLLVGLATFTGAMWRYPVPFFWVLFASPWTVCMVTGHICVSRGRLLSSPEVRGKIYRYMPSFMIQVSQIILYPILSALFGSTNTWQQIALTMIFPVIKYCLKRTLRALTHSLRDYAEEAAISDVEICSSIYQSMIMQTRPSLYATAFVIGVDLIQGMAAVKVFMDKHSVLPQHEIVSTAIRLLEQRRLRFDEEKLDAFATERISTRTILNSFTPRMSSLSPGNVAVVPVMATVAVKHSKPSMRDEVVLVHALEIVQAAESILLVEYLEVAIPVANAIFLAVATQFHSAIYNPRLYEFYYHHERLLPAIGSLALYTVLQLISVVLMVWVMRVRFRLSPWRLLAFHLEHHAWSIQGKMFAWLAVLLQFSMMHYGADFSFQFAFKVPTPED